MQFENHILLYVTGAGAAMGRLLRRALVRSERYSAGFPKGTKGSRKAAK